ncbi:MAG: PLP-dependent aminotransferase family protein [Lachnospiraceae bacterium]|nr:PLP-dependent aminotransferase family protein [Lachnospiraceae bacterium]
MLRYDFEKRTGKPLYEYLYECLKKDILSGRLPAKTKLPSKRELARNNSISVKTVMNAYDQLLVEGYITSREKSGYFVAKDIETVPDYQPSFTEYPVLYQEKSWFADFTSNHMVYEMFPFTQWRKVMRDVLSSYDLELVQRAHFQGVGELREAIADYLFRVRGMQVSPECIIIGSGIEYLYSRLMKILPSDAVYAAESPGYKKIPLIYREHGVSWTYTEMDEHGIDIKSLRDSGADVVHVSPEHHYPLGTIMSAPRRQELLEWAAEKLERYIIEDDYDCEFRYHSRMIPTLQSTDKNHRVIYINTFSKTLSPTIRISYMVLPEKLMQRYLDRATFYSNTASSCEQYALANFIRQGYFERQISRLKKHYHERGELLLGIIQGAEKMPVKKITGDDSGTHLLVYLDTELPDTVLKWFAEQMGVHISCLSEFCGQNEAQYQHVMIMNYSDLSEDVLKEAVARLENIFDPEIIL